MQLFVRRPAPKPYRRRNIFYLAEPRTLQPPGARGLEIKIALTMMGAQASSMQWEWPR